VPDLLAPRSLSLVARRLALLAVVFIVACAAAASPEGTSPTPTPTALASSSPRASSSIAAAPSTSASAKPPRAVTRDTIAHDLELAYRKHDDGAFDRALDDARAIHEDTLAAGVDANVTVTHAKSGGTSALTWEGVGALAIDAKGEPIAWLEAMRAQALDAEVIARLPTMGTGPVQVIDAKSGDELLRYESAALSTPALLVDDAHRLYFVPKQPDDEDDVVHVFDLSTRAKLPFFEFTRAKSDDPALRIERLGLSPDGKLLIANDAVFGPQPIVTWDLATRKRTHVLGPSMNVYSMVAIAFDAQGRRFAAPHAPAAETIDFVKPAPWVAIVDRKTDTVVHASIETMPASLAFSRDGRTLVIGGWRMAYLHDAATGKRLRETARACEHVQGTDTDAV
jgi:hypothetical protein